MPQPKSDADTLVAIHHARTQSIWLRFRARAYSHAWLMERGLPTGLPDDLRPKAERLYPVFASAVGVAVKSSYPQVVQEISCAMTDAVLEAEDDGRLTDSPFVKARMLEERQKARKRLFGRI